MQNALLLGSAIFFELIATSSLKASDGFTRAIPAGLTVVGYAASFYRKITKSAPPRATERWFGRW
jgi:multidrug transporter EmrE-like cation transporter